MRGRWTEFSDTFLRFIETIDERHFRLSAARCMVVFGPDRRRPSYGKQEVRRRGPSSHRGIRHVRSPSTATSCQTDSDAGLRCRLAALDEIRAHWGRHDRVVVFCSRTAWLHPGFNAPDAMMVAGFSHRIKQRPACPIRAIVIEKGGLNAPSVRPICATQLQGSRRSRIALMSWWSPPRPDRVRNSRNLGLDIGVYALI
jgi:hypothetical protein